MSAIPLSVDGGSKRWLVVLAATVVVSIVFVTYTFVTTLSQTTPSIVAPEKTAQTPPTEEVVARSEPDWNSMGSGHGVEGTRAPATRPDPFAAQDAAAAKAAAANDPVAYQQEVHRESESLRNLIAQGKLPKSYGNLTKEKVDQMEKDGVMIE